MAVSETDARYKQTPNGGFLVAETDDFIIEVSPMIFNWRIQVVSPELYGQCWEKGYCYFGTSINTLVKALSAAEEWATGDPFTTDPPGFDKQAY